MNARVTLVVLALCLSCRRDAPERVRADPAQKPAATTSVAPVPSPSAPFAVVVDAATCPNDRDCAFSTCCLDGEMCNGTVCYVPLLCGGSLPPCPAMTYCEHYEKELAGTCAAPLTASMNRGYCERMRYGLHILRMRVGPKPASGADGGCLPEMGDVHRGGRRWYEKFRNLP